MTFVDDPERALALSYAPRRSRDALAALFALDETLAGVVRNRRDPMIAQLRLTWWFEALGALDRAPAPAAPVLRTLAATVLPVGVRGEELAAMVEGWEALLEPAPDAAALDRHAVARGARLFGLAASVVGQRTSPMLVDAGAGWALADVARRGGGAEAARLARDRLDRAFARRWPRGARMLGAMALLARMDLATPSGKAARATTPRRIGRLAWHRLTGT